MPQLPHLRHLISEPSTFGGNLNCYVYIHRRATDGQIFYVGKGQSRRAWSKRSRNRYWHFVVEKHGHTVEVVESGLQPWFASEREIDLILQYKSQGHPLVNMTGGGEGTLGREMSDWHREKVAETTKARWADGAFKEQMREATIARWKDPKTKEEMSKKISAAKASPESRASASAKLMGIRRSEETKAKMREARRAIMRPVLCENTGDIFESLTAAATWLKQAGFAKARRLGIRVACEGKVKHAYGYQWKFAEGSS